MIGYLHRGVEKICESKTFPGSGVDGSHSTWPPSATIWAGPRAWKTLYPVPGAPLHPHHAHGIEPHHLHLLWLGTHALDIGAMTVFLYAFREREEILSMFEAFCGARLTTTAFRIGGLREDIPPGFEKQVRAFQARFLDCLDEYEILLTENRIWKKRTIGVALLNAEDAIALGVTGPVLRAAGSNYDIRKAFPYAAYSEMDFKVATQNEGDTYARYLVRLEEMRQAHRIVNQCLDGLPEGPVMAKLPKVLKSK